MAVLIIISIVAILVSFYLVVISLMNLFPFWIAFPLQLLSIMFLVHTLNERHRFKGFRSRRFF